MVIKPHLNGDAKHAPLRLLNQQLGGPPQAQVADVLRSRHAGGRLQLAVQVATAHAEEAEELGQAK